jgi:hypothetical protein
MPERALSNKTKIRKVAVTRSYLSVQLKEWKNSQYEGEDNTSCVNKVELTSLKLKPCLLT